MTARTPNPHQLALLDVPASASGPARLPGERRIRPAVPASLPLPFGAPPPDPVVEARRLALEKGRDRLRARISPASPVGPTPPPVRVDSREDAPPEPEEWVFVFPQRAAPGLRGALLDALAEALPGSSVRRGALELKSGESGLTSRADAQALRVTAFGLHSARWLARIREVAREHGLVEPE